MRRRGWDGKIRERRGRDEDRDREDVRINRTSRISRCSILEATMSSQVQLITSLSGSNRQTVGVRLRRGGRALLGRRLSALPILPIQQQSAEGTKRATES